MSVYACIKDGSVSNTIVIEEASEELINLIKEEHGYDDVIATSGIVEVGYTFDGTNFSNPNGDTEEEVPTLPSEVESNPGFEPSENAPNLNEL